MHQKLSLSVLLFVSLIAAYALVPTVLEAGDDIEETWAKITGPVSTDNSCDACHALEADAWLQTHHFATFKNRHKSARAKEILRNLGLGKRMRRPVADNMCLQCHYTALIDGAKTRVKWGVSCESCHGPARDWGGIHQKVGGIADGKALKWGDGKNELAADRAARLGAAAAAGMIHSEMIYEIAANCYGCHTVPNEELVNTGKHKAGSAFDLVAWSQGEIRHNFVSSNGAPAKPTNRPASKEQLRRLYVVGAMVDLEFSLRNLAAAQVADGAYRAAMVVRVNSARAKLRAILAAVEIPELEAAMAFLDATPADRVGAAARDFVRNYDGTTLGAIDGQIPIPKAYKGTVFKVKE